MAQPNCSSSSQRRQTYIRMESWWLRGVEAVLFQHVTKKQTKQKQVKGFRTSDAPASMCMLVWVWGSHWFYSLILSEEHWWERTDGRSDGRFTGIGEIDADREESAEGVKSARQGWQEFTTAIKRCTLSINSFTLFLVLSHGVIPAVSVSGERPTSSFVHPGMWDILTGWLFNDGTQLRVPPVAFSSHTVCAPMFVCYLLSTNQASPRDTGNSQETPGNL